MEDENKITSKIAMPSAAKIIKEKKLDISDIASTGVNNRVTKGDVLLYLNQIKTEDGLKVKNINKEKQINVRKGSGMDVLVPVLGESVVEATVSKWIKKQGEFVLAGEVIAAAGNESKDLDSLSNDNYPNDQFFNKNEFSDTFIKVGASSINLDEKIFLKL